MGLPGTISAGQFAERLIRVHLWGLADLRGRQARALRGCLVAPEDPLDPWAPAGQPALLDRVVLAGPEDPVAPSDQWDLGARQDPLAPAVPGALEKC